MKRIIDGKRYDTEKAEEIASGGSSHYSRSDFGYFSESLYRTPRGKWFLAGEGGAMTKYRTPLPNGACEGEGLFPLTEEEAREWLEQNDEIEAIERFFAVEDA